MNLSCIETQLVVKTQMIRLVWAILAPEFFCFASNLSILTIFQLYWIRVEPSIINNNASDHNSMDRKYFHALVSMLSLTDEC